MDAPKRGKPRATAGRISRAAAARIKRLRHERGWSTDHLEDIAGVGRATVSRIESGTRGKQIAIDTLVKISKAFGGKAGGASLAMLVYGEEE